MSATKAELQAAILVIDPSAEVEGLTNKELAALLSELEGTETETETETETGYHVAPGRAIHCRKGLLSSGSLVKEEYFANGAADLAALIAAGVVVES